MSITKPQNCNKQLIWYRNSDVYDNINFIDKPGYPTYHAYYNGVPPAALGVSLVDRSGIIKMPIVNSIPNCMKIPEMKSIDLSYGDCCRLRARELLDHSKTINKRIIILYSGGIDSSAIVVAFLDVCEDRSDYERVIVAHTETSIFENPSLYNLIRENFERKSSASIGFLLDGKYIIVNGECNDLVYGSSAFIKAQRKFGLDYLSEKTTRKFLISYILNNKLYKISKNYQSDPLREAELIVDNIFRPLIDSSIFDLSKLYYLSWYINFTLKWQNCYYRLYSIKCHGFKLKNLETFFSFFNTDNFQLWSMNNIYRLGILEDIRTYKQPTKDYIYSVTKDEYYRKHKLKRGSLKAVYRGNNVIHQVFNDDTTSAVPLESDVWINENSFI